MKDNEELLLKACDLVISPGTVSGFLPARMLIDCPSARAEENRTVFSDRGTFIIAGLFHDPTIPSLDYWEEGSSTPGDRELARILKPGNRRGNLSEGCSSSCRSWGDGQE